MLNNDQREEAKKAYERFIDEMPDDITFAVMADFSTDEACDIMTCGKGNARKILDLLALELNTMTKRFVKESGEDYKECLEYLAKKMKQKAYTEHLVEDTSIKLVKDGMDEQMARALLYTISEGLEKALTELDKEDDDETAEDQAE